MIHEKVLQGYIKESGRDLSKDEAKSEIYEIVQTVASRVASHFVFGYHTREDVIHQAMVFALEVLQTDKYDPERPLPNFLQIHIRNRMLNYKRKHFLRSEAPCTCCDPFLPPERPCLRWRVWSMNNKSKQTLMRPLDLHKNLGVKNNDAQSNRESKIEIEGGLDFLELTESVREQLPEELREDYVRMLRYEEVDKKQRAKVRKAVKAILEGEDGD